ncbi:MAG: antibiotic biosynthesis monooxygenase [Aestuariivita sp.]|nr:antibiotic biosynthesis monooxygenase [Aestuariivita sp.]MCY4347030.1 antibiotic biosynthesis monooxygenase [Aestuariivita sp.]
MYLTMNRFKVLKIAAVEFEALWKQRDSHLKEISGFVSFHLLRGPEHENYILYASHTAWKNEKSFRDWTISDAFRAAHKGAGGSRGLYLETPELEIFETVTELK